MKKLIEILNNPYITNNRMGNYQIKASQVKPKPAFTHEEKETSIIKNEILFRPTKNI